MKQENIKILKIEENQAPVIKEIPNNLKSLQKEVGGLIEIGNMGDGNCVIFNEEGKINGMNPNRWIGSDIICGPFFICGDDGEDFEGYRY
ncbi:MAG: DUF3846 domain-containing protein [Clostridia bacterium]